MPRSMPPPEQEAGRGRDNGHAATDRDRRGEQLPLATRQAVPAAESAGEREAWLGERSVSYRPINQAAAAGAETAAAHLKPGVFGTEPPDQEVSGKSMFHVSRPPACAYKTYAATALPSPPTTCLSQELCEHSVSSVAFPGYTVFLLVLRHSFILTSPTRLNTTRQPSLT